MSTPSDAKAHPADPSITREGAQATSPAKSDKRGGRGKPFRSGRFVMRFGDEQAAKAAGRDARAVGFVVEIGEDSPGSWLVAGRRRDPFPADDGDRYASRLRTIATVHRGAYHSFVED